MTCLSLFTKLTPSGYMHSVTCLLSALTEPDFPRLGCTCMARLLYTFPAQWSCSADSCALISNLYYHNWYQEEYQYEC